MKRSAFAPRSDPMPRGPLKQMPKEPKPAKGAKTIACKNRECRKRFVPDRPFIKHCSDDCAVAIGLAAIAKQKAKVEKVERAEKRKLKAESREPKDLDNLAQRAVNRYVLLRDFRDGCISCDKGPHWQGEWHCSHYKSRGASSFLKFNLWNMSKSCSQCNYHRGGNIAAYGPRLAAKFGDEILEYLKYAPRSREFSPEYLIRLARIFNKKSVRLERRLGMRK